MLKTQSLLGMNGEICVNAALFLCFSEHVSTFLAVYSHACCSLYTSQCRWDADPPSSVRPTAQYTTVLMLSFMSWTTNIPLCHSRLPHTIPQLLSRHPGIFFYKSTKTLSNSPWPSLSALCSDWSVLDYNVGTRCSPPGVLLLQPLQLTLCPYLFLKKVFTTAFPSALPILPASVLVSVLKTKPVPHIPVTSSLQQHFHWIFASITLSPLGLLFTTSSISCHLLPSFLTHTLPVCITADNSEHLCMCFSFFSSASSGR